IHRLLIERGIEPSVFSKRIKVLPLGHRHLSSKTFQQAGDALLRRRRLIICYRSYSQQVTRRTISPQTLVYYRDNWYLDAWCHMRDDLRVFSLARIESLELSDEPALEVAEETLRRHFSESYGIFAGRSTHTARLRFFPEI